MPTGRNGLSQCQIIRLLGAKGKNRQEVRELCTRLGLSPADATIAIQLGRGRRNDGVPEISDHQCNQLLQGMGTSAESSNECPPTATSKTRRYRDTASFGRRQEYIMAAALLRRNFDVYMTLVDDQGIDCVVRLDENRYVDVQIKARSLQAKHWNRFAAMSFEPRPNLFFILFLERMSRTWVIPSSALVTLARQNKSGKSAGCWTGDLPKLHDGMLHERFAAFEGDKGFQALKHYH